AHHSELDLDLVDARNLADRLLRFPGQLFLQRAPCNRQQDANPHPSTVDLDVVDHAELGDRLLDLWIIDRRQRLAYFFLRHRSHASAPTARVVIRPGPGRCPQSVRLATGRFPGLRRARKAAARPARTAMRVARTGRSRGLPPHPDRAAGWRPPG